MIHRLLAVLSLVLLLPLSAHAEKPAPAVVIKWGTTKINGPIGDAELKQIKAVDKWQYKGVFVNEGACAETLASLAKLHELKFIGFLRVKAMKDLEVLAPLKNLERPNITRPQKDDVQFDMNGLTHLTKIRELHFTSVRMKNISALKACSKLSVARFYLSPVESLDFVAGTPNLERLDLYGGEHTFPSYKPLAKLKRLRYLSVLHNTQAVDEKLKGLSGITSLEEFDMPNSKEVTNVNFLGKCKGMRKLRASDCKKLTDITALSGMPLLRELDLWGAPVSSIKPLASCKRLEDLNLRETKVADLRPLASCGELGLLDLTGTQVKDITPLAKCLKLRSVKLTKCPVKDISPLAKCKEMYELYIYKTQVSALGPLHKLKELKTLAVPESVPKGEIDTLKKALPDCRVR